MKTRPSLAEQTCLIVGCALQRPCLSPLAVLLGVPMRLAVGEEGASIAGTLVLGEKAGQRQMRLFGTAARDDDTAKVKNAYGFDVDASVRIAAGDRKGLERLARYMLRPPLSKDRIELRAAGRYRIRLKKPWRDGTTDIVLDGPELVGRLAALVPPPRAHLTGYFGVFAPRAKLRRLVVPQPKRDTGCTTQSSDAGEPQDIFDFF